MKKTLEVINELKQQHLIKEYAIGGAIAALKWTEPFFTRDLDIFIIPEIKISKENIFDLSPVYEYLKNRGYDKWTGQWLIVEGVPLEFIPAEGVAAEAVENAVETDYEGVRTRVMSAEYLIALFLIASREKDIMKIRLLLEQTSINKELLKDILERYHLLEKFEKVKR